MSNELHAKPPEASFEPLPPEEPFDLVWIDLETTGLDPSMHDIIEIAAATSHSDKPFEILHIFHEVLPWPDVFVHTLDPFVLETHGKTGLLRASLAERPLIKTKEKHEWTLSSLSHLSQAIVKMTRADIPKVLAGSTVHFDRRFIEWQNKKFFEQLGFVHRHYDVSSVKLFCQSLGMPKIPKGEAHRAKADIEESVAHARQCAEWLNRMLIKVTGASSLNQFRPSKEERRPDER